MAWEQGANSEEINALDRKSLELLLSNYPKKAEASESGNSPVLCGSSDPRVATAASDQRLINAGFSTNDLRRIGMKEDDVQMIMLKIASARADTDGQESEAESLANDSPPKTPAHEQASVSVKDSQDTGVTMGLSVTTESHNTSPVERLSTGIPSPIELPPSSPADVSVVTSGRSPVSSRQAPTNRLSLETPLKRDPSFMSSKESSPSQSKLNTPTTQLSRLGLDSPASASVKPELTEQAEAAVVKPRKVPPPVSVERNPGLDAISALCFLASTPTYARDHDLESPKRIGDGLEDCASPSKRPRRNVERRNWAAISGDGNSSGSSELGEARCLDDDELTDEAAAKALAVKAWGQQMKGPKDSGGALSRSNSLGLLGAVAMASPSPGSRKRESKRRDDEDEEEGDDEEGEDDEWSPQDGDWSPKARAKPNARGKSVKSTGGGPRTQTAGGASKKGHRAYPNIMVSTETGDDDDEGELTLPVDVSKKGGKIPELIRSKRAASGFVGVDFHEGKWRARVRIGVGIRGQPNRLVIGRYATAGEAAIAYAKYINSAAGKKLLAGGRQ